MLLLSTVSLNGYGLHKIFEFAKESNYDGLDLVLTKNNYDYWDSEYVKRLSDSFGIPVPSITVAGRGLNEKKVDAIMEIASTLKTQVVTFSPPHFSDKNTTWFTRYLSRVKRDSHISVAVQNVESKFIFFVIPEYKNASLMDIKKVTGDTSLDFSTIDASSALDILKAQKILGSSMRNIYVNDKHGAKGGLLPGNAGGGISYLPIESFLMKLKISGYNGFFTLKVTPSELGVGNNERIKQNLDHAMNYYKKHFLNYK